MVNIIKYFMFDARVRYYRKIVKNCNFSYGILFSLKSGFALCNIEKKMENQDFDGFCTV
jgi:hypothetical protein